jgi:hypothetical protein
LEEITFPYYYSIAFKVRPFDVCMSSTQEVSFGEKCITKQQKKVSFFQKLFGKSEKIRNPNCSNDALFENPHTAEIIKIANAGVSRWWIEISFGKWLFPEIEKDNLKLASPDFIELAENEFKNTFYQGCTYG